MKKTIIIPGLLAVVIFMAGCAPTRVVKPLAKSQQVLGLGLGGPIINYSDNNIPIPLASIYYARGITQNTTGFAGAHLTSLLFGVFHSDIGICAKLYHNDKWRVGISTSPVLNVAFDKWQHNLKVWPELDINAYWESRSGEVMLYTGATNWLELEQYRANESRQPKHWFMNPHFGVSYIVRKWTLTVEGKFLAPNVHTQPNVVEYSGINGRGAIGIYVGVNRTLR